MKSAFVMMLVLLTAACQSQTAAPEYHTALAADLTTGDLQELQDVINSATDSSGVRLNNQVFATSHVLFLSRASANTPLGRIATGRAAAPAETFHLLTDGHQCVLEHMRTGKYYPVTFTCQRQNP